jgi:DNA-binding IclR family transcriptional regulator
MSPESVAPELVDLVEKLRTEYRDSELDIAEALADAGEALSIEELAEATGYTERTVEKRVGTLEERLGGDPLLQRDDEDRPFLHAAVVEAFDQA